MGFASLTGGGGGGFSSIGQPKGEESPDTKLARDLERLTRISEVAGVPEPEEKPSPLLRAVDIVSRPLYSVAGFVDDLLNNGGSLGSALQRAGTEFFSGIGGLRGEKEDFTKVLEDAGVGEGGRLSTLVPFLYTETGKGWRFRSGGAADPTGRDLAGFALNMAGDLFTYLSFGTSRAAAQLVKSPLARRVASQVADPVLKRAIEKGVIPLSKVGREVWEEGAGLMGQHQRRALTSAFKMLGADPTKAARLAARTVPEAGLPLADLTRVVQRFGPKLTRLEKWAPDDVLRQVVEVNLRADQLASHGALRRLVEQAQLGVQVLDPGGIKLFGQTLPGLGSARFLPIANRTSQWWAKARLTPLGRQVAAVGTSIDGLFNQTRKAARNIPGFVASRRMFRGEVASMDAGLRNTIEELVPKSWGKETVRVGTQDMPLHEYVIRHLDNPKAYPAANLPPQVAPSVQKIQQLFREWATEEHLYGILDAQRMRANYVPHMYRNDPEQLEKLSATVALRKGYDKSGVNSTAWREARTFDTLDEGARVAEEMRRAGAIDFELDPILDLRELMLRRGMGHNRSIAMARFDSRVIQDYGLNAATIGRETMQRVMPDLHALINRQLTRGVKPFLTADGVTRVGNALADEKAVKLLQTADEKAAWLAGMARQSTSAEDYLYRIQRHKKVIEGAAPGLSDEMQRAMGIHRLAYLNSFNEPMALVESGPWQGRALPRAITDELNELRDIVHTDKDAMLMLKAYDAGTNGFKLGVTGMWPAFIVRNGYNNIAASFVELGLKALNPVKAFRAAHLMAGGDGTLRAGARRYTYEEVRAMARQLGVVQERGAVLELNRSGLRLNTIADRVTEKVTVPNTLVENHARVFMFMNKLEEGLDPILAAERVQRTLFDYGELSPVERSVMRRLFPFYTWTSKNIRKQAGDLLREPGRLAATQKIAAGSLRETGPDQDVLPEYLRGDFKIKLSTTRDGKKAWLTGIDLPFGAAVEQLFGSSTRNAFLTNINSLNPMLTTTFELATGRDLWAGRPLQQRQHVAAFGKLLKSLPGAVGDATRDWMEFDEYVDKDTGEQRYTISGTKAHLWIKSWALSRMFSTAESFQRTLEDDNLGSALLDLVSGVEFKEFDMTEAQRKHMAARIKRLEAELKRRGKLMSFERTYLPQGQLREQVERAAGRGTYSGFKGLAQ